MPSQTFENLPNAKKTMLKKQLLEEFSNHSLATAQVARIVKGAGISRGAFYKYFANLTDAYIWLSKDILNDLGVHSKGIYGELTADQYYQQVNDLLGMMEKGPYYKLFKMHYQANEGILNLAHNNCWKLNTVGSDSWAVRTLCHEAIRECLFMPDKEEQILGLLRESLSKILGR